MTVGTSLQDDFRITNNAPNSVIMMERNSGKGCSAGNRQPIAAILSTPMCIDDKDDTNLRLVSPRVVSPLECSMEPLKGTVAPEEIGDRAGGHRLVGFSDNVSVVFIPRRSDYPKDLRERLFPNKKEISRNAARNMKEYAAEGFDWRKVKEGELL